MRELRRRVHELDKRQSNFEAKIDMYMKSTDESMKAIRETVDRLDERMHNLTIATAIGVATIVVAIVLSR